MSTGARSRKTRPAAAAAAATDDDVTCLSEGMGERERERRGAESHSSGRPSVRPSASVCVLRLGWKKLWVARYSPPAEVAVATK